MGEVILLSNILDIFSMLYPDKCIRMKMIPAIAIELKIFWGIMSEFAGAKKFTCVDVQSGK